MTEENLHYDPLQHRLNCQGNWTLTQLPILRTALNKIKWPKEGQILLEGSHIKEMDSAGAYLLIRLKQKLKQAGLNIQLENFSKQHLSLLQFIEEELPKEAHIKSIKKKSVLENIGRQTIRQLIELRDYLNFIGKLTFESLRIFRKKDFIRFQALAGVIYRNGYQALPIIALLSFMIGVVIAYQVIVQLRDYGASNYIVDFVGLAVLREFGPMLTAIMVAGRTGSAYTAQLGLMKINQEIDALDTMGVTPADILILPRIMGLLITLPLLTMWANAFGILGGMLMAKSMLLIGYSDFLHRFSQVIPLRALLIGLGKAPLFALIIASIGCFQGITVRGSAESVGYNTTRSVVLAIFFIILVDAVLSVIFSELDL